MADVIPMSSSTDLSNRKTASVSNADTASHHGHSVARNSISAAAPRALQVATALGLTPFIIGKIGLPAYGVYSLVQTAVTYFGLADFGFPSTGARLVARANGRSSTSEIHAAVNTTMLFMAFVALIVLAVGLAAAGAIAGLWPAAPDGTPSLLRWSAIGLALTFLTKAVSIVPQGLNRWDIATIGPLVGQVVSVIVVVAGLLAGGRLPVLGLSFSAAAAAVFLTMLVSSSRLVALRWGPTHLDREAFRILRNQGANLFVVNIVEATSLEADQLMLLPFASLRFIGLYALGLRVATAVRMFALSVIGPLSTRVAHIEGSSGIAGVREYYPTATRRVFLVCVVPMMVAACASYPAVLAWLGSAYHTSALVSLILGLGFSINMLTGAGTATAASCGRADLDRNYSLVNLAINLLASALLGALFGEWGVPAGTLCGLVGSAWLLIWSVDRWLTIPAFRQGLDRRTIETGSLAVGIASVGAGVAIFADFHSRLTNLALAFAIVALAFYAGLRMSNMSALEVIRGRLKSAPND